MKQEDETKQKNVTLEKTLFPDVPGHIVGRHATLVTTATKRTTIHHGG